MYISLQLTKQQNELLDKKYIKYVDSVLEDDEFLIKLFEESFKGRIKGLTTEVIQSQEIKSKMMAVLVPFVNEKLGL